MKVLIKVALALALATPALAQQQEGIFPFGYRLVELENGFKAYLIEAGAPNQIAYVSIVRTGSREEWEPGRSGFAHFFEHMMFRGTEKYPNYDFAVAEMGAAYNGFTSSDRTVYYLLASNEYLGRIIDLESDRFMNLIYSEPDFTRLPHRVWRGPRGVPAERDDTVRLPQREGEGNGVRRAHLQAHYDWLRGGRTGDAGGL